MPKYISQFEKFSFTADGSTTQFTITHGYGDNGVVVSIMDMQGNYILVDTKVTGSTAVFNFTTAPANGQTFTVVMASSSAYLVSDLLNFVRNSDIGVASGVAPLDSTGKIPSEYIDFPEPEVPTSVNSSVIEVYQVPPPAGASYAANVSYSYNATEDTTTVTISHNYNQQDIMVQVVDNSMQIISCDVFLSSPNTVVLRILGDIISTNTLRVSLLRSSTTVEPVPTTIQPQYTPYSVNSCTLTDIEGDPDFLTYQDNSVTLEGTINFTYPSGSRNSIAGPEVLTETIPDNIRYKGSLIHKSGEGLSLLRKQTNSSIPQLYSNSDRGYVVTTSTTTQNAYKLFQDGDSVEVALASNAQNYVQIQLPTAKEFKGVTYVPVVGATNNPTMWCIQGSTDGTNFTNLLVRGWSDTSSTDYSYLMPKTGLYTYYRFVILDCSSNVLCTLGSLKFHEYYDYIREGKFYPAGILGEPYYSNGFIEYCKTPLMSDGIQGYSMVADTPIVGNPYYCTDGILTHGVVPSSQSGGNLCSLTLISNGLPVRYSSICMSCVFTGNKSYVVTGCLDPNGDNWEFLQTGTLKSVLQTPPNVSEHKYYRFRVLIYGDGVIQSVNNLFFRAMETVSGCKGNLYYLTLFDPGVGMEAVEVNRGGNPVLMMNPVDFVSLGYVEKEEPENLIPIQTDDTNCGGSGTEGGWYRAFDHENSSSDTCWYENTVPTVANPVYVWIRLSAPVTPVSYTVKAPFYPTLVDRSCPSDWKVQGSNNGSTWVDLDERTGQFQNGEDSVEYFFKASYTYQYFRLYVTARTGDRQDVGIGDFCINSDKSLFNRAFPYALNSKYDSGWKAITPNFSITHHIGMTLKYKPTVIARCLTPEYGYEQDEEIQDLFMNSSGAPLPIVYNDVDFKILSESVYVYNRINGSISPIDFSKWAIRVILEG